MRVALAIPAYGPIAYETARSLWRLTAFLTARGVAIDEIAQLGDPDLGRARNAILGAFLRSTSDRLLFVDTDVVFSAPDAWRLLTSEAHYVGANYPRKGLGAGWASTPRAGGEAVGELVEAQMLATGLLSLSREAVEMLAASAPTYESHDGLRLHAIATAGTSGERWISEDEAMCRRWQALGEVAWIDTSIACGHVGQHVFGGAP